MDKPEELAREIFEATLAKMLFQGEIQEISVVPRSTAGFEIYATLKGGRRLLAVCSFFADQRGVLHLFDSKKEGVTATSFFKVEADLGQFDLRTNGTHQCVGAYVR